MGGQLHVVRLRVLQMIGVAGLIILAVPGVRAGEIIRLFGEENTGLAAAQFLKIPVGARAIAMGRAYSSLAVDGSAPFWNAGGIMRTPGRQNVFFSHSAYTADISLDYLSIHGRRQNFGFGLSAGSLRSGDILRTTELNPNGTGQYFNANQFFVAASIARAMTDRFSFGGTVKYYQENLDSYRLNGVLGDLGILYFVGFGDLRVGFSLRNFGGAVRPSGSPPPMIDGYVPAPQFQSFPVPTEAAFGAARTFALGRNASLLAALDFNHPSDATECFRFGGELGVYSVLMLRAGYETSRDEGGFAAGFGVLLKRPRFQIRVDYAYADYGAFGIIHHFSVDLAPLVRPKDPDAWRRDR